jgi:hypothetical protein
MSDGFTVDLTQLRTVAGQLKTIGDTVGAAKRGLEGIGKAQTGDGKLADAVEDFREKWDYSLKKIGETAVGVGEQVILAAQGYDEIETGVADAAAGRA